MKSLVTVLTGCFFIFVTACDTKSLLVRDYQHLESNKSLIEQGDEWLNSNLSQLTQKADQIVQQPIYLITEKKMLPDSKDKHDYYSIATYYWPNPKTKDGLPYIHKDGVANPDRLKIKDYSYLLRLWREMTTLSLAYFYTEDETYATKANKLLNAWFIDSESKMNPNLNHAQAIPGKNSGRVEGIIDTRVFVDIIDAIELIKQSNGIEQEKYEQLKQWFSNYLDWLTNSQLGKQANQLKNNIGTAYAMQVVALSIFTGRNLQATNFLMTHAPQLLDQQMETDGKQPLELRRTRGWDYSISNLTYWFKMASMAERLNYDLWNYMTPTGKSINSAYKYLNQFASGEKKWEAKQILDVDMEESFLPLELMGDDKFLDIQEIQGSARPRRISSRIRTSNNRTASRSVVSTSVSRSEALTKKQRNANLSPETILSVQH